MHNKIYSNCWVLMWLSQVAKSVITSFYVWFNGVNITDLYNVLHQLRNSSGLPHKEMRVLTVVLLCYTAVLTASADVDLQVAFDNSAAFERLSSSHGVDDLPITYFITQTITSCAKHTGDRQRERQETVNVQRRSWRTSICQTGLAVCFFFFLF